MDGNIEGVEKVEESNGKYAFFMESASIEYLVERRCKLSQVRKWNAGKQFNILRLLRLEDFLTVRDMG